MNFSQTPQKLNKKSKFSKSLQHILLFFIRYISSQKNLRFLNFLSAFLLLILFRPTAARAVSVQLNANPTLISGVDCGIATYRFGTSTTYNGQAIDLLVEVLSEDNDTTSGCITYSSNSITVNMIDADLADNFAFMDLKITVVKKNTIIPIEIDRLAVSGFDLDKASTTGTDDVYFQNPDGTFISPGSAVTPSTGSFFGGQYPTYQTKLKGSASSCDDSPGGTITVTCRGAAMFVNGVNGPNTVSSVTLRVQNDNASSGRLFQLSFDFSYIDQLITNITDYGDAASSYGAAGAGASTALSLGSGVLPDNETTNQFSATANGDDTDGSPTTSKFDDEDAVKANNQPLDNQTLFTNTTTNLNVATFGTGYLSAWLDLNKNGVFDTAEKVVNDQAINSTTVTNTTVPITIPSSTTAGNTSMRFRFTSTPGVTATNTNVGTLKGEVEDYQIAIARYDFGDAPSSFGDASHDVPVTPNVYLGNVQPDKELATQLGTDAGAAATGDDNNLTPDDEDAFTTLANVSTIDNYDIIVPVNNTSGGDATLYAWVDFNKNGKFELGESKSVTVANNTTSVNLNWIIPSGTTPGDTYIRFRLTTANLLDTPGTDNLDERSIGNASNGEVEDYKVAIEPVPSLPPSSVSSCEVAITNGSFEAPALTTASPSPFQVFEAGTIAAYNENDVPGWTSFADSYIELWRTGNFLSVPAYEGQQFAEINAYVNGSLYQDVATTPGSIITWQFAHRGRAGTDTMNLKIGLPGATVAQINPTNGNTSFQTGNTAWVVYQGTYTVPPGQTTTRFEYKAVATATGDPGVGNFIDAVRFGQLCDHGDAKSNYPVLRSNNGAAHINDGLTFLGSKVRIELDGQPSTAADGDDGIVGDVDQIDDEDGVTFTTSTLNAGTTASLDVVASVPGYLNAWIDFNQDDDWNDPGEKVFTDKSLNAGTNNLSFTIPKNASTGDTFTRFRFSTVGGINPTGVVANGEVEDYQVAIAPPIASDPNLLLVKRITAINPDKPDEIQFNSFVDDPDTTNDDHDNDANPQWPDSDGIPNNSINDHLRGEFNVPQIKPGDEVEYTIYFLSNGDVAAKNVQICDVVPDNMTFVANSYATNFGMALALNATALPTSTNKNLSNAPGDDQGDFYPPNTNPAISNLCKKHYPSNSNNLILLDSSNNLSGAVLINLSTPIPPATGSGTPTNSYGFIRFRAKVK
jgi:uncharacterized repeat protein (TIGR01451 family)